MYSCLKIFSEYFSIFLRDPYWQIMYSTFHLVKQTFHNIFTYSAGIAGNVALVYSIKLTHIFFTFLIGFSEFILVKIKALFSTRYRKTWVHLRSYGLFFIKCKNFFILLWTLLHITITYIEFSRWQSSVTKLHKTITPTYIHFCFTYL